MSGPDMGDNDIHIHKHQTAVVFVAVPRKPKGELEEDEYPNPFRRGPRIRPKFDVALKEHVSFEKKRFDVRKEGEREASLMSPKENEAWTYSIETSLRSAGKFQKDIDRVYAKLRDLLSAHRALLSQYLRASKEDRAARAKEAIQGYNALQIGVQLGMVVSGLNDNATTRVGRQRLRGQKAISNYIYREWVVHNRATLKYLDTARGLLEKVDNRKHFMFDIEHDYALDKAEELGNAMNEMVRNRRI